MVDDPRCQLCFLEPGTLEHRHTCSATLPHAGWPLPSDKVAAFISKLSPDRQRLLKTRGLLTLAITAPAAGEGDTFQWLFGDTCCIDHDATWFIDGSLFDGTRYLGIGHAVGFGVVVLDRRNSLVAYGRGVPPAWVKDAAGAEAWAFTAILRLGPAVPRTVTDCLNVVSAVIGGRGRATSAKSPLARIWGPAFDILDDIGFVGDELQWMPAHGGQSSIGVATTSHGSTLTAAQWRANRLVDLLAKSAARPGRLSVKTRLLIAAAAEAVEYSLARLGAVTHAANHFHVTTTMDDGTESYRIVRDSGARPSVRPATVARKRNAAAALALPSLGSPGDACCDGEPPAKRRCLPTTRQLRMQQACDYEAALELTFQQHRAATRPVLVAMTGSAGERFAALRARIVAREAAAASELSPIPSAQPAPLPLARPALLPQRQADEQLARQFVPVLTSRF
jgi:hypothetical protein